MQVPLGSGESDNRLVSQDWNHLVEKRFALPIESQRKIKMKKYFIAWLLGVPIGILAIIWLVSRLF